MAETVRIEIPIEALDNTDPALANIISRFTRVENAARQAQSTVTRSNSAVTQFDRTAERTHNTLSSWMKEKYQLLLEAKDKVAPVVDKIKAGLKSIAAKAWNVTMKAVDLVTSPVRGIINLLKNPIFQVGAVLGVSIGLKDTIETFANFEAAMSQVKAISGATEQEFEQLNTKAKEMGATTKFTATESAEAFNYMAMAGWETQDMLNGISGIMALAAASGEDLATTSDIVTDALTAYGLTAKDAGHFSDVMAQAAASANTNVALMGETFKYVAPVAGALNYTIEDSALAIGLMGNASVKGSRAGTALKTALANMASPTDSMANAMKKYSISLTDSKGNMKSLKEVMDDMRSGLGKLSETEQTAAASTIFGKEAMAGMLAIINASEEDYEKLTEAVYNADGASQKMSNTMLDNLQGAFVLLQSAAEGVKITIGERLKPYLMEFTTWLTNKMPDIESAVGRAIDFIEDKIMELKAKIKEFTGTDEWKNADFFGKVKIAWDEIIAKPFSEWWDGRGQSWFINKAKSIGKGIGTAVSTGILALLGIDVSGAIDEGASVGASFARGLIDGFDVDAINDKLWTAVKGVFANASKILPGGEAADLTSWLSAAMIAKVLGPMLSTTIKGVTLGRTVLGSGSGGAGLLQGLANLGSNTAISLGAGNLAGGASLSAGALSALGLTSIAGGVVGGATAISGVKDLYTGFASDNEEEASAYKASGAWKVGGVAAGAGLGAAIGSVVPVLGTAVGGLIGAGIGGLVGWFTGEGKKGEYEKTLEAAELLRIEEEKAQAAVKLKAEQAKYETKELKNALADTSMTAEGFAQLFQKAVGENLQRHFGKVKLSMTEIQSIAKKLTFAENVEGVTKFANASQGAKESYTSLQTVISDMNKLNWKTSLGLIFDDTDIQEYTSGIDTLIQSAKEYIESQHYEAKTAIDLLVEPSGEIDMTSSLNSMYESLQEQINSLGTDLTAKVNVALEDGVITLDEQEEILNLQRQITEITEKVSAAQTEAEFKALKIKYGGADLDADSFAALQAELQQQVENATQSYDQALKVGIANLELELSEGVINQEEYDTQLQALTEGYEAKISDLNVRVESFQLESIAEAYSSELDGILPEIEGTTAEKLQTALHNAIANGTDATTWDMETAARLLGLESLSMESQAAIASMMSGVAAAIPDTLKNDLQESFRQQLSDMNFDEVLASIGPEMMAALSSSISGIDMSPMGASLSAELGNMIHGVDKAPMESALVALVESTGGAINSAYAPGFKTTTDVTITANYKLANPTATISFSGGGSGTATVNASIAKKADGDIITGPLLSWVGEDGPEAIIPLGGKRRSRGLSLWEKAGELLGVKRYANGGVIGSAKFASNSVSIDGSLNYISKTVSSLPRGDYEFSEDNPEEPSSSMNIPLINSDGGGKTEVKIEVHLSPSFEIAGDGNRDEDILRVIRKNLNDMADELNGKIAERMGEVFSNMPLKGVL